MDVRVLEAVTAFIKLRLATCADRAAHRQHTCVPQLRVGFQGWSEARPRGMHAMIMAVMTAHDSPVDLQNIITCYNESSQWLLSLDLPTKQASQ